MEHHFCLLDEPVIRARRVTDGQVQRFTLPGLFVAMGDDQVRDFPALRPHQRHPWHAFLVQLAAMALHQASRDRPFESEAEWRSALVNLTPDRPDGSAWCLIAPHDQPAFMQAPVPQGRVESWNNRFDAADELDMLVTSKNHDLKVARIRRSDPDDWLFGLVSLQTQEGVLGSGKYGVSRMNGGFGSRPGLGVVPGGHWGRRWQRDVQVLLSHRATIAEHLGLMAHSGIGLVWLQPWSGDSSLAFDRLDPFYIEICRRIRLYRQDSTIRAIGTGSKKARIDAKSRNGITGDPWTPVETAAGKALTITARGFGYQQAVELLFGSKFRRPVAQGLVPEDGTTGIVILAQGITRGQGKTEGYHERRIPISPTVRKMLMERKTDQLAKAAETRVQEIGKIRGVLWTALATLFDNGAPKERFSDGAKDKANLFGRAFEQGEDARFFEELNAEIESIDPKETHLKWLVAMSDRAEKVLWSAFEAGPRSSEQRYRARTAALNRFHGALRSEKTLPSLANYLRQLQNSKEIADGQS